MRSLAKNKKDPLDRGTEMPGGSVKMSALTLALRTSSEKENMQGHAKIFNEKWRWEFVKISSGPSESPRNEKT